MRSEKRHLYDPSLWRHRLVCIRVLCTQPGQGCLARLRAAIDSLSREKERALSTEQLLASLARERERE
jgi:hypothetical protein